MGKSHEQFDERKMLITSISHLLRLAKILTFANILCWKAMGKRTRPSLVAMLHDTVPKERNLMRSTESTVVLAFYPVFRWACATDAPAPHTCTNDLYTGLFTESLFIAAEDQDLLTFSLPGAGWLNYSISTQWNTRWLLKKENFFVNMERFPGFAWKWKGQSSEQHR